MRRDGTGRLRLHGRETERLDLLENRLVKIRVGGQDQSGPDEFSRNHKTSGKRGRQSRRTPHRGVIRGLPMRDEPRHPCAAYSLAILADQSMLDDDHVSLALLERQQRAEPLREDVE